MLKALTICCFLFVAVSAIPNVRFKGTKGTKIISRAHTNTGAKGFPEAKIAVDAATADGKFDYATSCLAKPVGSIKVVCQLKDFPEIGVATCLRGSPEECQGLVESETKLLGALEKGGLTVIPFSTSFVNVPCYADNAKTCPGYLLTFLTNAAKYDDGEGGTESMLKPSVCKGDGGFCVPCNQEIIKAAKTFDKVSEQYVNFARDMQKIYKYFKDVGIVHDFQGMLDLTSGHFFVADPQTTDTEKCAVDKMLWLVAEDKDPKECAIMTRTRVVEGSF